MKYPCPRALPWAVMFQALRAKECRNARPSTPSPGGARVRIRRSPVRDVGADAPSAQGRRRSYDYLEAISCRLHAACQILAAGLSADASFWRRFWLSSSAVSPLYSRSSFAWMQSFIPTQSIGSFLFMARLSPFQTTRSFPRRIVCQDILLQRMCRYRCVVFSSAVYPGTSIAQSGAYG